MTLPNAACYKAAFQSPRCSRSNFYISWLFSRFMLTINCFLLLWICCINVLWEIQTLSQTFSQISAHSLSQIFEQVFILANKCLHDISILFHLRTAYSQTHFFSLIIKSKHTDLLLPLREFWIIKKKHFSLKCIYICGDSVVIPFFHQSGEASCCVSVVCEL